MASISINHGKAIEKAAKAFWPRNLDTNKESSNVDNKDTINLVNTGGATNLNNSFKVNSLPIVLCLSSLT